MPIGWLPVVGITYSLVTFGTNGGGGVAVPLVSGVPFPQAVSSAATAMAHTRERAAMGSLIISHPLLAGRHRIPAVLRLRACGASLRMTPATARLRRFAQDDTRDCAPTALRSG